MGCSNYVLWWGYGRMAWLWGVVSKYYPKANFFAKRLDHQSPINQWWFETESRLQTDKLIVSFISIIISKIQSVKYQSSELYEVSH